MQEKGVIEPVKHPTDWVNSMVCTEKKNGKLRPCLDPRELNKYIMREHYMIPTFQKVIADSEDQNTLQLSTSHELSGKWNLMMIPRT